MSFRFQNGATVDEDAVVRAMNDREGDHAHYLDIQTGRVEEICLVGLSDHNQDAEKRLRDIRLEKNKRYFKIPAMPEDVRGSWFQTFLEDVVRYQAPELAERYLKDLKEDVHIDICEINLACDETEWTVAWDEYLNTGLFTEMKRWLSSLPVRIKEEMDLFDDCAVCQKMKAAGMHEHFLNEECADDDARIRV